MRPGSRHSGIVRSVTGTFFSNGIHGQRARGSHRDQLSDGRVLIAGGSDGTASLSLTEIYDPATNTFSPGPTSLWRALCTPRRCSPMATSSSRGINQSFSSLQAPKS